MTIFQSGPGSHAPGPLNRGVGTPDTNAGSVDSLPQPTSSGLVNAEPLVPIPILGRGFRHTWVASLTMPSSGTSFSLRASYEDIGMEPGFRGILIANNGAGTLQVLQNRTNFTYTITAGRNAFLPLFMAAEMIDLTFTNTLGFANCSAMLTSEEMVPFSI